MTRSQDAAILVEAIKVARSEHFIYGDHRTLFGLIPWYCPGCSDLLHREEAARRAFDEARVNDIWEAKKPPTAPTEGGA